MNSTEFPLVAALPQHDLFTVVFSTQHKKTGLNGMAKGPAFDGRMYPIEAAAKSDHSTTST